MMFCFESNEALDVYHTVVDAYINIDLRMAMQYFGWEETKTWKRTKGLRVILQD